MKLLIGACLLAVLLWGLARTGALSRLASALARRRLGGYRHQENVVDESLPSRVSDGARRVVVIGGGLGAIGAAATLAERGIAVTVLEKNAYLGGKIGAWQVNVGGAEQTVDHGFHAFFRQYYNLNGFLERIGITRSFLPIEDYLIFDKNRAPISYGGISTIPGLNLLHLASRRFYRLRDVIPARTRKRMQAFVRFDMKETYEQYENVTFERFCDEAKIPASLRVSFRTFARAFFSDETDLCAADVLRAFHFYYLSHDLGLMYDYPAGDYETTVLAPIRDHLERSGAIIQLNAEVTRIENGQGRRFRVLGNDYDDVIVAADIPGMKAIIAESAWLVGKQPSFFDRLQQLTTSRGYAVWRIWVDRDLPSELPTFINVDKRQVLDSVTLYHRVTDEARAWATAERGAVLELHSYALPQGAQNESDVKRAFLEDLDYYFPDLQGLEIRSEYLQVRHDFPAFAPGQHRLRPSPRSPVEGLFFAGDWVRLPFPMTHMEAAFTCGMVCANHILEELGLRQEPVFSVAPRGLMATTGR